jgi:hypothetical protein
MDEIIGEVQVFLPLGVKPNMTSTELDYIASLDGEYRKLAIFQAVEGQLIRMGLLKEAQIVKADIVSLGALISAQEVKAYQEKRAWVDKYGNYSYGSIKKPYDKLKAAVNNEPVPWDEFDCVKCNDTGWLANYNTIGPKGKIPCSCEKGQEKAKKTEYMGPVTSINSKPKSFPSTDAALQQWAEKKQQQAVTNKFGLESLYTNMATGVTTVNVPVSVPVPIGPPELPKKGRKFR